MSGLLFPRRLPSGAGEEKMKMIRVTTDHHEDRKGGAKPSLLILHYTDTQTLSEAEDYFTGRRAHPEGGRVSAHYMIDYDGTVVQYVEEERRAWHAGVSYWGGVRDVNSHSIGIELVNPGRKYGYRPFAAEQMDALAILCRGIMERHGISPHRVLGHSDVAPGRRADPGELFDWKGLARAGCAVWPEPGEEDRAAAPDYAENPARWKADLTSLGYDPAARLDDLVTAFRQHFYPESFAESGGDDAEMAARLHWLARNARKDLI